jgi:AcrR family transcriptional regulator
MMNGSVSDKAILDQVGRLLAQGDAASVTMDRIAAETGLSRATIYRRFGSREALLRRAAEQSGLDAEELSLGDAHTRILQAARAVFSRQGFAATTIEQIAQEAGVGPATVYRHFGSKAELIESFIHASSPRKVLRQLAEMEPGQLGGDLTLFATTALKFLHDNRDLIWLTLIERESEHAFLSQLRGSRERTVAGLARYLERQMAAGVIRQDDPFAMAVAFVGSLLSAAVIAPLLYDRPLENVEKSARQLVTWFLEGVQAQRSGIEESER